MKYSALLLQIVGMLALYTHLQAQCTYTTMAAGDYFTASNWVNGLQPPNPIPVGVTVTLDHNMTVGGTLENNGSIVGASLTIISGGSVGGSGAFSGTLINQGEISPGYYAPINIVNTLAGVATSDASGITASGAICGGEVCHDGGAVVSARGVCYGINPNPDITGLKTTDGTGTGVFVSTLAGLSPGTTYYARAYATNSVGTSYGKQITFNTVTAGWTCGDPLVYGGQSYATTLMPDGKCWMAENLNIGNMISGGIDQTNNSIIEKYCYDNNAANCNVYGGLYQWAESIQYLNGATNTTSPSPAFTTMVQGVCPSGWHMPSLAEWTALSDALPSPDKGSRLAGNGALWANGGMKMSAYFGTTPFVALPAGSRSTSSLFDSQGILTNFWASDEFSSNVGWVRYIYYVYSDFVEYALNKSYGFSIRCVQD